MNREQLQKRITQLEEDFERCKAQANVISGALIMAREILTTMESDEKVED